METNLKRLERLKNIRMPELSNQSADFQDCFKAGGRVFKGSQVSSHLIFEINVSERSGSDIGRL